MKSGSDSTEDLRSDGEEPSPPQIEDITGSRRAGPQSRDSRYGAAFAVGAKLLRFVQNGFAEADANTLA